MRREPREPAPPGYEWDVGVESDWRVSAMAQHYRCRNSPTRRCTNRPVAFLSRSHGAGTRDWAYCEEHMYGRWIQDGVVWGWRLREVAS